MLVKFSKNYMYILTLILLFMTFIFACGSVINETNDNICVYKQRQQLKLANNINRGIEEFSKNKVIIVGDSRMELIEKKKDEVGVPNNMSFIAKSGAGIDWFKNYAIVELKKNLDKRKQNTYYHVVINMGVNDLDQTYNYDSRIRDYLSLYKSLILKYPDVKFYFLSVNPVNEKIINKYWVFNIRTNSKIEDFNRKTLAFMSENKFNNFLYCDSYNNIDFGTYDGLHYTDETDKKIVHYINNKCIDYKKS